MKKWLFHILLPSLLAAVLILAPQRAEAAGSSFEGDDDELRAGDRVTVTYYVSGDNLYGITASMDYDSSKLEWLSISNELGGAWKLDENGSSSILLYDSGVSDPIDGWEAAFSVTFRVRSGVSAGATVSASVSGTASDGSSDSSLGTAYWEAEILPPLSDDAELDDLWCDEADIGFTGGSEYSIEVPYDVTELELDWEKSHSGASVSVSGNSLSVGSNTVTLTVTAEDGTVRRYYLYVTRGQDPNYKPGSDASLSALSVSGGQLSPSFHPDVTEYVVYLPYEAVEFYASGTARDSKAIGVKQSDRRILALGENVLRVICTAEDGTTTKEYRITAIRMPQYAGTVPAQPSKPTTTPDPTPEKGWSLPETLELPYVGEVELLWVVVAAGVLLLLLLVLLLLIVWFAGKQHGEAAAAKAAAESSAAAEEPITAEETPADPVEIAEETPAVETSPAEDVPAEALPVEEPSAEETPKDNVVEEISPAEEIPAEEPAIEEAPAEAPPAEVPAEDAPPAEEAPTEEEQDVSRMTLSQLLDEIRNM